MSEATASNGNSNGNGNGNGNGRKAWKDRASEWLFQQGVSTVLLFGIVICLWYGIPWWENRHQAERKEMRDELKEARTDYKQSLNEIIRAVDK